MSKNKSTPGPWDVHETYTIEIHPLWDDAGDHIIAEIPKDAMQSGEEKLANARLIAAAPELLEAIDKIGILLCDSVVGKMVKSGTLTDGLCEEGETETGLALIVVGHLFKEFNKITDPVRKKARGE